MSTASLVAHWQKALISVVLIVLVGWIARDERKLVIYRRNYAALASYERQTNELLNDQQNRALSWADEWEKCASAPAADRNVWADELLRLHKHCCGRVACTHEEMRECDQ